MKFRVIKQRCLLYSAASCKYSACVMLTELTWRFPWSVSLLRDFESPAASRWPIFVFRNVLMQCNRNHCVLLLCYIKTMEMWRSLWNYCLTAFQLLSVRFTPNMHVFVTQIQVLSFRQVTSNQLFFRRLWRFRVKSEAAGLGFFTFFFRPTTEQFPEQ